MRTRKEIESLSGKVPRDFVYSGTTCTESIIIELLLDIRDLLNPPVPESEESKEEEIPEGKELDALDREEFNRNHE